MRRAWLLGLLLPVAACVDETHEQQVQALGPEDPAVPQGPLHRPGQPCIVCHGSEGPASARFLMAGTVYAVADEAAPAKNAQVTLEDVRGSTFVATTNAAGNFFVTPDQWSMVYPVRAQVANAAPMISNIKREGSCAGCHTLQAGPASAGRVYVQLLPANDTDASASDGGP